MKKILAVALALLCFFLSGCYDPDYVQERVDAAYEAGREAGYEDGQFDASRECGHQAYMDITDGSLSEAQEHVSEIISILDEPDARDVSEIWNHVYEIGDYLNRIEEVTEEYDEHGINPY